MRFKSQIEKQYQGISARNIISHDNTSLYSNSVPYLDTGPSPLSEGLDPPLVMVVILSLERELKEWSSSLRASSPIWASEASLARTRERALGPSLARSREAHFACPNRRACSQANGAPVNSL